MTKDIWRVNWDGVTEHINEQWAKLACLGYSEVKQHAPQLVDRRFIGRRQAVRIQSRPVFTRERVVHELNDYATTR